MTDFNEHYIEYLRQEADTEVVSYETFVKYKVFFGVAYIRNVDDPRCNDFFEFKARELENGKWSFDLYNDEYIEHECGEFDSFEEIESGWDGILYNTFGRDYRHGKEIHRYSDTDYMLHY